MHPSEQTNRDGDPIYRKNPAPKHAYRITMSIEDAPGPFGFVSGATWYDMTNHEQCTPIDRLAGVWTKRSEEAIPIAFQKIDARTYSAIVYADAMVDADYFGKGICHWEVGGVSVTLKATGTHAETRFQPALFKHQFFQSRSIATFFWKRRYPKSELENYPDSGHADTSQFKPELRSELFSVTLISEKVNP